MALKRSIIIFHCLPSISVLSARTTSIGCLSVSGYWPVYGKYTISFDYARGMAVEPNAQRSGTGSFRCTSLVNVCHKQQSYALQLNLHPYGDFTERWDFRQPFAGKLSDQSSPFNGFPSTSRHQAVSAALHFAAFLKSITGATKGAFSARLSRVLPQSLKKALCSVSISCV